MKQFEQTQARKRRIPAVAQVALAAMLVVGCVAMIAAGVRERVDSFEPVVIITPEEYGAHFDFSQNAANPVVLEDGRLWFVEGETRTDITNVVDGDTPMYRAAVDPETGEVTAFLAVGGTPEDFGFAAFCRTEEGYSSAGIDYCTSNDGTQTEWRPWLLTAVRELGVEDWLER